MNSRAGMKIIDLPTAGGVDMLTLTEMPDPEPQDDEVLIQVRATVVNGSDIIARQNFYPKFPVQSSYMGLECAGIIEKVGKQVKKWNMGDEVCAILCGGGYAEKVVVPEGQVFLKPNGVSFARAACLPHASCVVWSELFMQTRLNSLFWLPDDGQKARLSTGQTLLVHEDCNGISDFAIQIAQQKNVKVCVTCHSQRFSDHCNSVGGTHTLCIARKEFLDGLFLQGVDVSLNSLGPEHFHKNISSLINGGIMINTSTCCSDTIDSFGSLPSLADKQLSRRVVIQAASLLHRSKEERAMIVSDVSKNEWSSIHLIKPFVHPKAFEFSMVREAHRLMEAEDNCGKIVLIPDEIFKAARKEDVII